MQKNEKRYISHRKKILKEKINLIYDRNKINQRLRKINKDLDGWDRWLIAE